MGDHNPDSSEELAQARGTPLVAAIRELGKQQRASAEGIFDNLREIKTTLGKVIESGTQTSRAVDRLEVELKNSQKDLEETKAMAAEAERLAMDTKASVETAIRISADAQRQALDKFKEDHATAHQRLDEQLNRWRGWSAAAFALVTVVGGIAGLLKLLGH
jgi:hypothetical protein